MAEEAFLAGADFAFTGFFAVAFFTAALGFAFAVFAAPFFSTALGLFAGFATAA